MVKKSNLSVNYNSYEDSEDELHDISFQSNHSFIYDKIQFLLEKSAETRWGQVITKAAYRTFEVMEETTKWSLPNNDVMVVYRDLSRPLPWVLFLPLIVWLRFLRAFLTIGGKVVGKGPVTPQVMVAFLQNRRRNIRAIRLRSLRAKKKHNPIVIEALQQAKPTNNKMTKLEITECSDDESLSVNEMLIKYANENMDSDADPEFRPNLDDTIISDEDTESSTSSSMCSTIAGDDDCFDQDEVDQVNQADDVDELKSQAEQENNKQIQTLHEEVDKIRQNSISPPSQASSPLVNNAQFDIKLAANGFTTSSSSNLEFKDSNSTFVSKENNKLLSQEQLQDNTAGHQLYNSSLAPFDITKQQKIFDQPAIETYATGGQSVNTAEKKSSVLPAPDAVEKRDSPATVSDSCSNNSKQRQIPKANITTSKSKTMLNQKNR